MRRKRTRRRAGGWPTLKEKWWYRTGDLYLFSRAGRTYLNLEFHHDFIHDRLEDMCLKEQPTPQDIRMVVEGLPKSGELRRSLHLPYPPPSVSEAWRRATHVIDQWLDHDLGAKLKETIESNTDEGGDE